MTDQLKAQSGIAAVDRYLIDGYNAVPGMSSQFAAAIGCGLIRIQTALGVSGHVAEIGTFQGRYFIAMAKALADGERALGIDRFDWPTPAVLDRFEKNCRQHDLPDASRITWKADSRDMRPEDITTKLGGGQVRFFHIDGEHTRAALTRDLELATAVLAPGGLLILDDMLHPGYPTLVLAVHQYLERHADMTVLCIVDRESITAASKFVLCRKDWFKRYEAVLIEDYKANIWPMGADFEPHWCLVLSLDTTLPDLT